MKIVEATVTFPAPIGTYYLSEGCIGGHPFPSEGEAWVFEKGLKLLETFILRMNYDSQLKLLKDLGIK